MKLTDKIKFKREGEILIVDDAASNIKTYLQIIQKVIGKDNPNYTFRNFEDGRNVQDYIQKTSKEELLKIAFGIFDNTIKGNLKGLDLIRMISEKVGYLQIPIISISGDLDVNEEIAFSYGACGFILKPAELQTVEENTRRALNYTPLFNSENSKKYLIN